MTFGVRIQKTKIQKRSTRAGPAAHFVQRFRAFRRPQKTNGHDSSEINGRRPMRTEQHRPFGGAAGRTAPPEHKRAGRTQTPLAQRPRRRRRLASLEQNQNLTPPVPSPLANTPSAHRRRRTEPNRNTRRNARRKRSPPPRNILSAHCRRQTEPNRNIRRKVRRQRSPSPRPLFGAPSQTNRAPAQPCRH